MNAIPPVRRTSLARDGPVFLIRFSINNALTVNLLLMFVVVTGVLSWYAMPQEMFPVVEQDIVSITTEFEGAPPEEVEKQVTLPIEDEFDGLSDIDEIYSASNESLSTITIKLKPGSNVDDFLRDARNRLDQIKDLPDEAEPSELQRLETRFPVIFVSLYGDVSRGYLFDLAERIKRRLQAIPGTASVGVAGQREWELWVVVRPDVLAANKLALSDIVRALRENLRDLPGGSLEAQEGDILLRGMGYAPTPEGIGRVPLRTDAQGGQLLLGEVATVERRLEEAQTLGRFNGKPSVNLTVTKTVDASTIEVSEAVRKLVDELRHELPPGVRAGVFSDLSVYVKNRLDTVKSSGLVGLVLVLLSLYLFLNFRVALITAMGIPISFLVAVIALHYLGHTINMVSLFAFLIALGLIVDDAIIVNENIYRHMELGVPARKAAQIGAAEVFWPVIASTTTTVAAFLPMFAISGTMGAFIAVIPIVVSAALLGSLAEAFLVLPSHAAELLRAGPRRRPTRIDWAGILRRYTALLRRALRYRYVVVVATLGVLVIALVYAQTRLPFNLFGRVELGQFFVNIEAPNTYSLEDSSRLATQVERLTMEVIEPDELQTLLTNVGVSFIDFNRFRVGSRYIQLQINLEQSRPVGFIERFVSPLVSMNFEPAGTRERGTETIVNALRDRLQSIPGIQRMSIVRPQGGPAGNDIEVGVAGPRADVLRRHADEISAYLASLPGVYDVQHDMEVGKLEYRYSLNDRGRELGLTQRQISDAVRTGFLGLETVYVSSRDERLPVRLIYDKQTRQRSGLRDLPITLGDGRTVYLGEVADIEVGRGLSVINRRDLRRLAIVTAEVDDKVTTALEVNDQVQQRFAGINDAAGDYELLFLGQKKEANESFRDMKRAGIISLAIIFFILGTLFRSLLDPLVVMLAIPFGIIGVIFGHAVFGYNLQFLSMIGLLALSGIIVNDSLILVDFAKRLRAQGMDRIDSMVEAGRVRIRPILLTSVTTFLGISPLIFFATGQTAFLSPMAVSLGFGLLFATVLILVVLPCLYLIADDARTFVCTRLRRALGRPEPAAQAPYCRLRDPEPDEPRSEHP